MHKDIAIKVHDLTKTYKLYSQPFDRLKEALNPLKKQYHQKFDALKNVSFEIKKGETVGIIGKNGSGKSTILKIICGVLTPTSGRVTVRGKVSAILELGAGFNPEMTGLENIYLSSTINGLTRFETEKNIAEIIAFSELGDFIYQPVKTYSSGMKARLSFGVAIHVKPDILIVDEALSVGDAAFQRKCFAKMEQIRKSGATILFVSHSEGSIVSLCNRVIWISNGRKIIDGTPKTVTALYLKYSNIILDDLYKIRKEFDILEATQSIKSLEPKSKIQNNDNDNFKAFLDQSLYSKSAVHYNAQGAKIMNVYITTLEGEKVNVLLHGKEYYYCYSVQCDEQLDKACLGFLIKKKNGVEIGGGSFPAINKYICLPKGENNIQIQFSCVFNEGIYFMNAGVLSKNNDQIDYAHRILDVYTFKVINAGNRMTGSVRLFSNVFLNKELI